MNRAAESEARRFERLWEQVNVLKLVLEAALGREVDLAARKSSVLLISPLVKSIHTSILDRFSNVRGADSVLPGQVGNGAGHLEHAVKGPRAQAQLADRHLQEL